MPTDQPTWHDHKFHLSPDPVPICSLIFWQDCFFVQYITNVAQIMILTPLQTGVSDCPASFVLNVNPVTCEPETYLVVPDSNRIAWCFISSVFNLDVSVVDLDGVSSVQVEVLDTKSQITVIFELWRVLHIDIVLANGRRVIVIVVVVAEHRDCFVVEIVTAKLRSSVVYVVFQDFATATKRKQRCTPYEENRDHIPWK